MGKTIEAEGSTVDEAIGQALEKLGASREEVKVEILSKGSRGLFGRLTAEKARVKVTVNDGAGRTADFIEEILAHFDEAATVSMRDDGEHMKVDIAGEDLGLLIGRHGETLAALQCLANAAGRRLGEKRIVLDIEGYRARRLEKLEEIAKRVAEKVALTGRPAYLRPMNSFERRAVHLALQDDARVTTESAGEEPERRVQILPGN